MGTVAVARPFMTGVTSEDWIVPKEVDSQDCEGMKGTTSSLGSKTDSPVL
jgi:hypothetical protein